MLKMIFIGLLLSFSGLAKTFDIKIMPDTLIEPRKENPTEVLPDTTLPDSTNQPDSLPAGDKNPGSVSIQNNVSYAIADLNPTQGHNGSGRITFTKLDNGIKITGEVSGLSPGMHGIHIHEFGDCSDAEAKSAGDHFNPDQMPHAGPEDVQRHTGDLGNIEADQNGIAKLELTDSKISFEGPNSIIGKAVIVHQDKDDLKSQPSGASGKRILCGIIKPTEKE
jgi:Cu-Zn family superoxide dismutase